MRSSKTSAEASEIIFSNKERPGNCIRLLNLNTMMLPLVPENKAYKSGCQYERLADFFVTSAHKYDIMCCQELFGMLSGELKEIAIEWA